MYVKVKNESVSCSVLSDYFVTPWTSPPGSSPCNSPGKNTGVGCHSPGDFPDPRIEPRSPALQVDSLLSEPPGKPHICIDEILIQELITCFYWEISYL